MDHILVIIHLSMDTQVASTSLAAVTSAAVNMVVQISLQDPALYSFGNIPAGRMVGSYDNSILML